MARAFRTLAIVVATAIGLFLLYWGYVFGRCEGWKGIGTCPRVPLWDWETFWIIFWAGAVPTIAVRLKRHRLLRTTAEALGAGALLGAIVVIGSGF